MAVIAFSSSFFRLSWVAGAVLGRQFRHAL
jgi:hypothetical protein